MSRWFAILLAGALCASAARANGLLIPTDKTVPPLALVSHDVDAQITEQVAVTTVTQVFRNHTGRDLEATFIFPVPQGASVDRFAMWIGGKEVKGEMVEADKAKQIYTDIVRRMQDPGLLEYVGHNLLKLSVYPVPANGDQKLTLSFTSVVPCENGLAEYTYPLKCGSKAPETPTKFTLNARIMSEHPVHSVYSPTHSVAVKQPGDREAKVSFTADEAKLDRDFQLYYSLSNKDVGLTAMSYRPKSAKDGSFLFVISPRAQLAAKQKVSRDVVFVLDTSGSMTSAKMDQARKAVKYCIDRLDEGDRFNVLNFATTVNHFNAGLVKATKENRYQASQWVDELMPTGGTAIDAALTEALAQRRNDRYRTFTVVFFTDGMPTVGETRPEKILKRVKDNNTANTRIFTFGVGDDVNAAMLDRLAEETRSVSTYVRPEEDIEAKVSGLYGKVSQPVLTDLKLSASNGIQLAEVYPRQLPDLFHGGQLVVLGRYRGDGPTAITLTGLVGDQKQEFVYELTFPKQTGEEKGFVETLWARRKVAYLLDQIRESGKQKELVDEVVMLARKHGITTPFTSYLVVPDNVPQVAQNATPRFQAPPPVMPVPAPSAPAVPGGFTQGQYQFAPQMAPPGVTPVTTVAPNSYHAQPAAMPTPVVGDAASAGAAARTRSTRGAAPEALASSAPLPKSGKAGVDLSVQIKSLTEAKTGESDSCLAAGRRCVRQGEGWVDTGFAPSLKQVKVKALSGAYFRLLEKHPELKEVFKLGQRVVWVTPSGAALVIAPDEGQEAMSDGEIAALFKK